MSLGGPLLPVRLRPARDGGGGRPYGDDVVGRVRALVEGTWLSPREIAGRAGVSASTVYRWSANGAWPRPLRRAGPGGRRRGPQRDALAEASRRLGELKRSPAVDLDGLTEVLGWLPAP